MSRASGVQASPTSPPISPSPHAIAREACPDGGDVVNNPEGGSATKAVLRLEGDGFLVVGEHGCRDAFVLALEVRP